MSTPILGGNIGGNNCSAPLSAFLSIILAVLLPIVASAESDVRMSMQLNSSIFFRESEWWQMPGALADLRIEPKDEGKVKAQAAIEYLAMDEAGTGGSTPPALNLKRLWIKASFPNMRLTAGKTKLAWGNGNIFNAGDILFGSANPLVDFTQSVQRDDTAFLTALNIPLGRFSYIEVTALAPNLNGNSAQTFDRSSAGLRFFTRIEGFRLEGGYLYKGDKKVASDFLGHRPYLSFHGHAGIDFYGAASLAAGRDPDSGMDGSRDSQEEILRTINMSAGLFHQFQIGYGGTLGLRLEASIMPWQRWESLDYDLLLENPDESYGLFLYPEISIAFAAPWTISFQSIISPIDGSAQLACRASWNVFQGFNIIGIGQTNLGGENTLFAWTRSASSRAESSISSPEGLGFTLGISYTY